MKKIKSFLLMTVIGLCSFATISVVNAASFDMSRMNLVCEPSAIEGGERSTCYLIGRPSTANASDTNHGYVAQAYTTKSLKIIMAQKNENVPNTNAVATPATSITAKPFATISDAPAALKNFTCIYDEAIDSEAASKGGKSDYQCLVFYSTTAANAFNPVVIKNNITNIKGLTAQHISDGYGVIGSVVVELDADAKVNECGELCIKVWQVPDAKAYDQYKDCAVKESGDPQCGEPTKIEPAPNATPGGYFCEEMHLKTKPEPEPGEDTPPTGAFASYAVLAAGALIAVSAIAMAKKNNKFNKI